MDRATQWGSVSFKSPQELCQALFGPSLLSPFSGFGGGPYQLAHLAPTYAGKWLL